MTTEPPSPQGGSAETPRAALSIVVPTRNRASLVDGCLESLLDQTAEPSSYEVIVADNGSTDDTARLVGEVAAATRGRVRLVDEPIAGVNRARNAGLRAARGDAVAFVDDDERAPRHYVADVLEALAMHEAAAGVGGPVLDQPGTGRTCGTCGLGAAKVIAAPDGTAERLLGGNMALRRSAFEAVGLFDERLSGRGDETEWFGRARDAGLHFHYDDTLCLEHRRDVFSTRELLLTQLRQGRARPLAAASMGEAFRPRPVRALRGAGHAMRRRCVNGWVLAAREVGAIMGSIRHPSTLRRRTGGGTGS